MIRLEGAGKIFASPEGPRRVLQDITLSLPKGTIQGLIGRSGAGKSTLLRLINGLERPSEGRVLVGGEDVTALDGAGLIALRRRVGMIFQQFNLISTKSVAQNVALPLVAAGRPRDEIRRRVDEVLERVDLAGRGADRPSQLSGGEKQRVGIARALISGPEVLLCDEATSALDPETTTAILGLLRDIRADLGVTILLITHEMAVIREICDRAGVLEAGRLVEEGPVWQLLAAPRSAAARALLAPDKPQLPAALAASLRPAPFPGAQTVVALAFDGTTPADLPPGRWLAGRIERVQNRDLGRVLLQLPPGTPLPLNSEILGYVAADD